MQMTEAALLLSTLRTRVRSRIWAQAAIEIRTHGLAYGERRDKEGRMCIGGAINKVMNGNAEARTPESWAVTMALEPYCLDREGKPMHPVDWSNNWGRRTAAQAVEMLERASREAADAVS